MLNYFEGNRKLFQKSVTKPVVISVIVFRAFNIKLVVKNLKNCEPANVHGIIIEVLEDGDKYLFK